MEPKQIVERMEFLKGRRGIWENHWQDCADFVLPQKNNITTQRQPGEKKGQELYDSTAAHHNELLAGALHGMLTNPTTPFFDFRFGDDELDSDNDIRKWLDDCVNKITFALNNSNFQTEIHEVYIDETTFGTAGLSIEEDDDTIFRFSSRPLVELFAEEDNKGKIDTIYRLFKWNARQIALEFGEESLTNELKDKLTKNDPEQFEIIHAIYPRNLKGISADQRKIPTGYPIASMHVLKKDKHLLNESGFHEMPLLMPRWVKTSGETYGRSPTMKVLSDVKMLNKMKETAIRAAQKAMDPPLQAPDDGFIGPILTGPSTINYYRSGSQDRIEPINSGPGDKVNFSIQVVEDTKKAIREGYYTDQLQLNQSGPQMTATEVDRRSEDAMRLLGPMMGRQHSELLQPAMDRIFGIMLRKKKITIPPEIHVKIAKKKLMAVYSSLVARAQRVSEGNNIQRTVQAIAPFVNADPSIMDNIDGDAVVKYAADIYGMPARLLKSKDEVKKSRDARAQANAAAKRQMDQAHQADQVSKVAPAMAQVQAAQNQQKGAQ